MARIRTIKPTYFMNEDLADASRDARLLGVALLCMADRAGRLADRPKMIKLESFPWDDVNIDALLEDLVRVGYLMRYEAGGRRWLQIVTFEKHQRPHPSEAPSAIPGPDGAPTPSTMEHQGYPGGVKSAPPHTGKGREGKGTTMDSMEGEGTDATREHAHAHASEPTTGDTEDFVDVEAETPKGSVRGMGSAVPKGAADVATDSVAPAGPVGVPKGPEVPIGAEALAAVAAVLPAGSLCTPAQAPAQAYSILKTEYPHQDYPLVHSRWRDLGPDLRAAWVAEALGRPEVQGKKMADQWRSAARHIGRALHDGFDLLTEVREAKVVAHAAPRSRAGGGRMSNQATTVDVIRRAMARGGGA